MSKELQHLRNRRLETGWLPLLSGQDLEGLFSQFFSNNPWTGSSDFPKWEYFQDQDRLVIRFAIAGYPREAIHVEATDTTLTVKGDKVDNKNVEENRWIASRAFSKDFHDSYSQWDFAKAGVTYRDGLLEIVVPQREEKKPKLLEIK